jgi:ABC-type nickel/cobalt efflux system permease component RcnA
VFGLDQLVSGLADGHPAGVSLAVALLLGLRHASDPDHLVAVSTLVASERDRPRHRAGILGLAWGAGHATTLILLGSPIVVFGAGLPEGLSAGAEVAIGGVIAALGMRLLLRWRRGCFHAHEHAHGGAVHRHLHRHEMSEAHAHSHVFVRSRTQAFGIGLVHGIGGSGAVAVLLIASTPSGPLALTALFLFALATAVSMTAASAALGYVLGRERFRRPLAHAPPALASLAIALGVWYAAAALI